MAKNRLKPTAHQTFRIEYDASVQGDDPDFGAELIRSRRLEDEGRYEEACNVRYEAFQKFVELIPDDDNVELDWDDEPTSEALLLAYSSAIDFFLVGDWEMCAAQLEMVLELDAEDHMEATVLLAYAYVAMGEYDSYDEIVNDINDKLPDKVILSLWSEWRRAGLLPEGDLMRMRRHFAPYWHEFTADEHPVDAAYRRNIALENPPKEALARELWIQTEHLWRQFPDFIEALRASEN